jgi:tellurite resistance protein
LPLTSLADDVAAFDGVMERLDGPVVLVGHAYAGDVIAALSSGRRSGCRLVFHKAKARSFTFARLEGVHVAAASPRSPRRTRIPPNLLAIPFGLSGLGDAWDAARPLLSVSAAVPQAIYILAALVWLALVLAYAAQGRRQMLLDLHDPVQSPFVALAVITPMILAAALASVAYPAGRVLVVVFLVMTLLLGGWLTGQWMVGDLSQDVFHPGYFLPTVAGGLVGAYAAAAVHLHGVAVASFGIGIICWLLLGSTVLSPLFFRPTLPPTLIPTLAIEAAPPALAGFAYFAVNGRIIDSFAYALGGYAVLMVLVQMRFIPCYRRLRFSPGFWAFAFAYGVVAADTLVWITLTRPAGATGYAVAVITLITLFIAAIAVRTVIAVARGRFPGAPQPAQPESPAHLSRGRP